MEVIQCSYQRPQVNLKATPITDVMVYIFSQTQGKEVTIPTHHSALFPAEPSVPLVLVMAKKLFTLVHVKGNQWISLQDAPWRNQGDINSRASLKNARVSLPPPSCPSTNCLLDYGEQNKKFWGKVPLFSFQYTWWEPTCWTYFLPYPILIHVWHMYNMVTFKKFSCMCFLEF